MLPTIPNFKTTFCLSDDAIRSSAVIRPTTADMLRFIVGGREHWPESWKTVLKPEAP